MTTAFDHELSPRRRWHAQHHFARLWRRQKRESLTIRAHFWQMAWPACLLFWAVVGYGIHSL